MEQKNRSAIRTLVFFNNQKVICSLA